LRNRSRIGDEESILVSEGRLLDGTDKIGHDHRLFFVVYILAINVELARNVNIAHFCSLGFQTLCVYQASVNLARIDNIGRNLGIAMLFILGVYIVFRDLTAANVVAGGNLVATTITSAAVIIIVTIYAFFPNCGHSVPSRTLLFTIVATFILRGR
jgi:voltage-gated potassium channel Kch